MNYANLHKWNLSPKEAIKLQKRLRKKLIFEKISKRVRLVAGVDVSVKGGVSRAAIVVMTFPELEAVEKVSAAVKTTFPYIPGLLSFREAPAIFKCVKKLKNEPDIFIFDGQGTAHPREIGIASHLGLFLNKPTIGSAKSHLFGEYGPCGSKRGDISPIKNKEGKTIGAVLRSRAGVKPIFISPGHLADTRSSVEVILACSPKFRIPEPIRAAHRLAGRSKN